MQIRESRFPVIPVGRLLHIGARHFQAGEKSGADRNNAEQRQKAFLRPKCAPKRISE